MEILTSRTSLFHLFFMTCLAILATMTQAYAGESKLQILLPNSELKLGSIYQGDHIPLEYKIKNVSKKTITFDAVIPQGVGPKNIKFPKSLKAGQTGSVRFEFVSAYLSGEVKEYITIVDIDNNDYGVKIIGEIKPRFFFNAPELDFGFLETSPVTKSTYVWGEKNKKFDFETLNNPAIKVETTPVYIDVSKIDDIKEVKMGNPKAVFGHKITITVDPKNVKKSLRQLVSFKSSTFPKATPEIYLVGYKK